MEYKLQSKDKTLNPHKMVFKSADGKTTLELSNEHGLTDESLNHRISEFILQSSYEIGVIDIDKVVNDNLNQQSKFGS